MYFALIVGLFRAVNLPAKTNLSLALLAVLFAVKVGIGCLNLYFHYSEYISNDAHMYFSSAMTMLADFKKQPSFYLYDWFLNWGDIGSHLNFLDRSNSVYWSDVGRLMHQRYMILCTVLSFGHEYVNVLFYNLFFFIGSLALFKTFLFFKSDQKWLFLILIFLVPSVAFWCSGIHKDGFVLSLIGLVSWSCISFFKNKTFKNGLLLVVLLFLMLAFRYFYFLVFLPFFVLYLLTKGKPRVGLYFTALSLVGILSFFYLGTLSHNLDVKRIVVNRQQEFLQSKGYSDLGLPTLENSVSSFVENFPVALKHIFLEPIPRMGSKMKYDLAALDSILVLGLFLIGLFYIKRKFCNNGYLWLLLFYSIFILIFIGYTIPNLGALVRYESPFICLLLLTVFAMGNATVKKLPLE